MVEEMSPRERVMVAVEHKEADRIPIHFGPPDSGIIEIVPPCYVPAGRNHGYTALLKYLGFYPPNPEPRMGSLNEVTNIDERVLKRLHVDTRLLYAGTSPRKYMPDGSFIERYGFRWYPTGPYYDVCGREVMRHVMKIEEMERYPWPDPHDPIIAQGKEEEARRSAETGYWIIGVPEQGGTLVYTYVFLFGFERAFTDPVLRPEFFKATMDRMMDVHKGIMETFLQATGDYIDALLFGDDMGAQGGPIMSLDFYRKHWKAYQKELIQHCKKFTKAKIHLHSCGSNWTYVRDFREIGIDILENVQAKPWRNEPWRLKRDYGNIMCFWGGIDTQELLPFGTLEDIEQVVRETMRIYGERGGYILALQHTAQAEVPAESIVAVFDGAYEYGKYPLPKETQGDRRVLEKYPYLSPESAVDPDAQLPT
jgi:uroporphyrinogen decarboxylase